MLRLLWLLLACVLLLLPTRRSYRLLTSSLLGLPLLWDAVGYNIQEREARREERDGDALVADSRCAAADDDGVPFFFPRVIKDRARQVRGFEIMRHCDWWNCVSHQKSCSFCLLLEWPTEAFGKIFGYARCYPNRPRTQIG